MIPDETHFFISLWVCTHIFSATGFFWSLSFTRLKTFNFLNCFKKSGRMACTRGSSLALPEAMNWTVLKRFEIWVRGKFDSCYDSWKSKLCFGTCSDSPHSFILRLEITNVVFLFPIFCPSIYNNGPTFLQTCDKANWRNSISLTADAHLLIAPLKNVILEVFLKLARTRSFPKHLDRLCVLKRQNVFISDCLT